MCFDSQSAESIAAIVFGLLQLAVGLMSLWQQRQLRQAHRQCHDGLAQVSYADNMSEHGIDRRRYTI